MRARLHDMLLGMARHDLTDVCRLFALERLLFFSNPGHSSSARHGAQEECRYGNTSHHAAVLPFVLHGAGWSAAQELMAEALESAPVLLVLDYRQPERNLDFPAVWLAAEAERIHGDARHRVAWRQFMDRGGIEAFVRGTPLHRVPVCGGAASLVLMASAAPP